ncbi:protein tyrosine phosphatase type IVA 1 isoform X3 [Scophthalmus maximus]|uniref:protein tyrosine phosphatase type IVA 1 isoform X3 n=1 Tax=Scophthalmus maximus TaxID=52904 RepID=UPI0015E0C244|nr:protein tyrosine phosphatase type IVA 1 isoform X3 [Scophthalmus maximus]
MSHDVRRVLSPEMLQTHHDNKLIVLWCSGSHIYGVSEGQWGLLPGSARCLCRRVNGRTRRRRRSEALEPQERPWTGTPPRTSDNSAWMGPAPVEITYKNMRFLITHNPTNATLNKFIEELKKYGVTTVVRVCEATYDATLVVKEGIQVLDWPFDDGAPPSNQIVDDWLNLLKLKFREEPGCCVAVHCVAGLGRAPVLVALALIECGMKYEDAVQFIRQKRRGAFNSKQLFYLEKYRPKMRLRFKDSNGHRNNCCIQ